MIKELYIRFLVWLGAEPPTGYEYLLGKKALPQNYTLKPGETIYSVARKFGVNYKLIAKANKIDQLEAIGPDQTLLIPAPDWEPDPEPEPASPPTSESSESEPASPPTSEPSESEPAPPPTETPPVDPVEPIPAPVDQTTSGDSSDIRPDPTGQEAAEPEWLVATDPTASAGEDSDVEWLITDSPGEEEDQSKPPVQLPLTEPESESDESTSGPPLEAPPSDDHDQNEDPSLSAPADVFRYAIQRGDTLNAIARKYGITVKDLVEANDINDPSRIYPGQKLIIPGYMEHPVAEPVPPTDLKPPPVSDKHFVYTVASGDTLNTIAKRYGITVLELIEANQLEDPIRIYMGQKLIIPGIMPAPKPQAPGLPTPIVEEPYPESQTTPFPPDEREDDRFPPIAAPSIDQDLDLVGPVDAIRALYMSYFAIGHERSQAHIIDLLDTTELNAVVLDVKSDYGLTSYPTQIALAREIGAVRPTVSDLNTLLAELKRRDIYTIARIVTFKDSPLAKSHPELAVKTASGALWQDREGQQWTDPFLKPVWDYNIKIAVEAASLGFDEIQFDFLRFPTTGQTGVPNFSQEISKETRVAAITTFLSIARGQLATSGVKVGAKTFGYTCWRKDDSIIGQDIERMGQYLDVLSPMLYPSAFGHGIPGYKLAVAHPYEVVYESATRAVNRVKKLGCVVRPWLQDFQDYRFDRRIYGPEEIQAQIKASFDSGSSGYMVWVSRGIPARRINLKLK